VTERAPFVVREYEEVTVELSFAEQRALRALAGNRLVVLPGDSPGSWRVRAGSYVGTVAVAGVRILIKPKVTTANLFHLLEAGGEALDTGPEIFDYDVTGDLLPAFATFYARHLEATLGHGIVRAYCPVDERLVAIRGRIDVRAQLSNLGLPLPVACRFDDYSADITLNRVVKAAALRLIRLPGVTTATRRALLQLLGRLEEVGPASDVDLRAPTSFNRLNAHYRGVERLARLVLQGSSLIDATGAAGAAVFLLDMNKLFEEFVEARLGHYLDGRLRVVAQRPTMLDAAGHVRMLPDLVFEDRAGRVVYVADSKYKVTAGGYGRDSDYYQLLAYTTALQQPEGVLIYCRHDGTAPARWVDVPTAGKRLRTRAVRLDKTIACTEHELRALADEIAGWAETPGVRDDRLAIVGVRPER